MGEVGLEPVRATGVEARCEGAITRAEISRGVDDRSQVEAAEAELAEMGAAYWATEARLRSSEVQSPVHSGGWCDGGMCQGE